MGEDELIPEGIKVQEFIGNFEKYTSKKPEVIERYTIKKEEQEGFRGKENHLLAILKIVSLPNGDRRNELLDEYKDIVISDSLDSRSSMAGGAGIFNRAPVGINLWKANLSGMDFSGLDLRNFYMPYANLNDCCFDDCDFRRSIIGGATAKRSSFVGADMRDCVIKEVNFEQADLRAYGYQLDDNYIKNCRMRPGSSDHYSVLRRTYTGSKLLAIVIATIFSLIPFALRFHAFTLELYIKRSLAEALKEDLSLKKHLSEEILTMNITYESVFQYMVKGLADSYFATFLQVFVLTYLLLRYFITSKMNDLVDEEKRTGYIPPSKDYSRLFFFHRYLSVAAYFVVAFAIYHWVDFLFSDIATISDISFNKRL